MSADLIQQLEDARTKVAQIEREIRQGPCRQYGHDWQFIGGRNAGCNLGKNCNCSALVYICSKCGDCDYGDNEESRQIVLECEALR